MCTCIWASLQLYHDSTFYIEGFPRCKVLLYTMYVYMYIYIYIYIYICITCIYIYKFSYGSGGRSQDAGTRALGPGARIKGPRAEMCRRARYVPCQSVPCRAKYMPCQGRAEPHFPLPCRAMHIRARLSCAVPCQDLACLRVRAVPEPP